MGLRGYTMHDVLNILTDGEIVEARGNDEGNFNCKIIGLDIEGNQVE
jgi:hypothetical protein